MQDDFEMLISPEDYHKLKFLQESQERELKMLAQKNKELNMQILRHSQQNNTLTKKLAKREEHVKYLSKQIIILSQKLLAGEDEMLQYKDISAQTEKQLAEKYLAAAKQSRQAKEVLDRQLRKTQDLAKTLEFSEKTVQEQAARVAALTDKNEEILTEIDGLRKNYIILQSSLTSLQAQKQVSLQNSLKKEQQLGDVLKRQQTTIRDLTQKIKQIEDENQTLAETISELNQKNLSQKQQSDRLLAELEVQLKKMEQMSSKALQEKVYEKDGRINELIVENVSLEQKISSLNKQVQGLFNDRQQTVQQLELSLFKLNELEKKFIDVTQESQRSKEKLKIASAEKTQLQKINDQKDSEIGILIKEIDLVTKQNEDFKQRVLSVESMILEAQKNSGPQLESLKEAISSQTQKIEDLERTIQKQKSKIKQLEDANLMLSDSYDQKEQQEKIAKLEKLNQQMREQLEAQIGLEKEYGEIIRDLGEKIRVLEGKGKEGETKLKLLHIKDLLPLLEEYLCDILSKLSSAGGFEHDEIELILQEQANVVIEVVKEALKSVMTNNLGKPSKTKPTNPVNNRKAIN